jgi:DNA primase
MKSTFTEKILQAKELLPLEQLIEELGDEDPVSSGLCPFHPDSRPSFSIFEYEGVKLWKCHAGCGAGDQIKYLEATYLCSRGEAIRRFLALAGVDDQEELTGGGTFR